MTLIAVARPSARIFPLVAEQAGARIAGETARDVSQREALLDAAFGAERFAKTCERLREGRLPARHLALVAHMEGELVATLRFWHVEAGGVPALLLGPLAAADSHRTLGLGSALMQTGLSRARALGHEAVILVGDEPYYRRFGFARAPVQGLDMPGWVDPARFLGLELVPGALAGARGLVVASGLREAQSHSRVA
jgi:predicted N-acetyltransferase YhbS